MGSSPEDGSSRINSSGSPTRAIARANRAQAERSIQIAVFLDRDAAVLDEDHDMIGRFDYIVAFDAIHDQSAPLRALEAIYHALDPEGTFSMIDIAASSYLRDNIDHPLAPFLYTVSLMHCLPVGLHQGGEGLGMMWGREKARRYLEKAGFAQVEVHAMDHDPFNCHYLARK